MDSEEDADDENICSFCKRGFVDGYSLIGPYSKVGSKKTLRSRHMCPLVSGTKRNLVTHYSFRHQEDLMLNL